MPAYTLYKFKKLFGLVFLIFIALILLSLINPEKEKAISETAVTLDKSGVSSQAINIYNSVPNPEDDAKQASGNILLKLLNKDPVGFILLVLLVAGVIFLLGIHLKDVRALLDRILRF